MAARRFAVKAIDWMAFAERVPPNQKAMFNALKTRSDTIAAKLTSLPENPPAIDWAHYRAVVAKAGLVDEFEKKYKALSVPEPKDTQSETINAQEKEAGTSATTYIQESKARVADYEKALEKFRTMIPFEEMTLEEYHDAFPETRLDKEKNVLWPHRPISEL
uniref:ATP synthase subunit d, mitochondrial n=1 Tax=Leptobrachium leishanense TaxID=445787 RepID=A0A8C5WLZ3_9ANUR